MRSCGKGLYERGCMLKTVNSSVLFPAAVIGIWIQC